MRARKAVHPLLLEPTYWRSRLDRLDQDAIGVVWTPRPDLSGGGREVCEFRIRAHDGGRLWGLFARPTWQAGPWPARVRSVGPAVRPRVDTRAVQSGAAEFVFQEPAGRRLSDRVLDVMQVCRVALATKGINAIEVEPPVAGPDACNDELLIAGQLLSSRIGSRLSGRFSAPSPTDHSSERLPPAGRGRAADWPAG